MAGDNVCGGSNMTLLLRNDNIPCDHPLWVPTSSDTLPGANSMINFENVGEDIIKTPFCQSLVKEEHGDTDFDVCFNQPGKKRRLTTTQVQFLERSFEVENKIEPERKIQLAKELGLQPRQVAIWFQNRRARFKIKQLEKDYDSLKGTYDGLKADYDNLLKQNENLKIEVISLKERVLNSREKGLENLEPLEAINSPAPLEGLQIPLVNEEKVSNAAMVIPKQEDASSAKSDIFYSDSPHSFLEPADSSHVFEPDQSDFSQDEEDNLGRSFLPPSYFPKLYHDPPANSCNFELKLEDQPFWSWNY